MFRAAKIRLISMHFLLRTFFYIFVLIYTLNNYSYEKVLNPSSFFATAITSGYTQQNDYLVSTTSTQQEEGSETTERQFIDSHFNFYSLCDWSGYSFFSCKSYFHR